VSYPLLVSQILHTTFRIDAAVLLRVYIIVTTRLLAT